jgi:hypothetical protein
MLSLCHGQQFRRHTRLPMLLKQTWNLVWKSVVSKPLPQAILTTRAATRSFDVRTISPWVRLVDSPAGTRSLLFSLNLYWIVCSCYLSTTGN